jgi:hypothetical protein
VAAEPLVKLPAAFFRPSKTFCSSACCDWFWTPFMLFFLLMLLLFTDLALRGPFLLMRTALLG